MGQILACPTQLWWDWLVFIPLSLHSANSLSTPTHKSSTTHKSTPRHHGVYKKYSGPFANAVDAVGCQLITAVPLPGWLLSGQIQSLLPDSDAFQKAAREQPLSLAPGLTDVLKSGKPPSLDFFKSLPGCTKRHQWGIYVLVLERPGSGKDLHRLRHACC